MASGGLTPCNTSDAFFASPLLPTDVQSAHLHNILRSNAPPPEASSFRTTISAIPAKLDRYDTEIARLQNRLNRLTSERRTLAAYADGCRGVFSPVRRLPAELLAEIFAMCFPAEIYKVSSTTTPNQEVNRLSGRHLLQLAQVSSLWYHVAMGTPKLWSTIALDTTLWRKCTITPDSLISLLETALNRGDNHPLTMGITVSKYCPHEQSILELLSKHAARWQHVYLSSDADFHQYLTGARGNLGRLETLHLIAPSKAVDIFREAPRLTKFTFGGEVQAVPDIPWTQVIDFSFIGEGRPFDPAGSLSPLTYATNLATSTFHINLPDHPHDMAWSLISSDVRGLSFIADADSGLVVGQMFDSLTLPSLQSFTFIPRDRNWSPYWPTDHFRTLADRSRFANHLTRFQIHAIVKDSDLLRCLEVLPGLEELFISDSVLPEEPVITDLLLQGLAYDPDSTTLILKLRSLRLASVLGFTDAVYLAAITSRVQARSDFCIDGEHAPFETDLWWPVDRVRDVSSQTLERLTELTSGGGLVFDSGVVELLKV